MIERKKLYNYEDKIEEDLNNFLLKRHLSKNDIISINETQHEGNQSNDYKLSSTVIIWFKS